MDKFEQAKKAEEFAANFDEHAPLRIQDWFHVAWARRIPPLLSMPRGTTLNLGAGNRQIGHSAPLDLEHGWNAEEEAIPAADESIAGIWAHGFFEHLDPETVIKTLRECERVLIRGGILNIVVPHGLSELYHEELEHYSPFHEETLVNLFRNPYYQRGSEGTWSLRIHTTFMMAMAYRNMALMMQLVKDPA